MIYLFVCIIWWCYACVSLEFNIIWHIWGFYVLFLEIQLYSHWEWYQNTSIFFLRKWYNEVISYLIKIDIVYNFADLTLAFKVQQNMTYLMFLLFVFGKPSIHQYRVFSETYLSIFGRQVIEWINQSSKMLIDCCCCFLYNLMMLYSCIFKIQQNMTHLRFLRFICWKAAIPLLKVIPKHISLFLSDKWYNEVIGYLTKTYILCVIWWWDACVPSKFNIIWHIWGFYILFLGNQVFINIEYFQNTSIYFSQTSDTMK